MSEFSTNAVNYNAEEHPPTEQLRSFATDELVEDQRTAVWLHLSGCADCRGLLAVIAPEDGPPPAAVRPTRKAA